MRATRKVIVTDARNGLLSNGCAQGVGQIPDARNPFNCCSAYLPEINITLSTIQNSWVCVRVCVGGGNWRGDGLPSLHCSCCRVRQLPNWFRLYAQQSLRRMNATGLLHMFAAALRFCIMAC